MSTALDSLTPEQALAPYRPDRDGEFDQRRAAHLLLRAGFGLPKGHLERTLEEGPKRTVERLLTARVEPEFETLDGMGEILAATGIEGLQAWVVTRMLQSSDPLREKLALFWHGHFATSERKVNDAALMLRQYRLFLNHGLGRFSDLLTQIARDPAMLIWLDSEKNQKLHPNENFARELFELFTLGIGHYTEQDVQEAARALTGWRRAGGAFRFVDERHDDGEKTVLGRRGRLGQTDILELCTDNLETARRLTRKLLVFFVHPQPREAVVDRLARDFLESGLDVSRCLETVFRSRYFHADENLEAHILSPVEFVVGSLRTLGARVNAKQAAAEIAGMGQRLFLPPSVKGWEGERAWIHAGAMIARMNCATRIAQGNAGGLALDLDLESLLAQPPGPAATAAEIVNSTALRMLARPLDPAVVDHLSREIDRETDRSMRIQRCLQAVLCLPEASIN